MSESEIHSRLVNATLRVIREWASNDTLDIWADQPTLREHLSPYAIGEVQPDIIAIKRDTRFTIFGEAKTAWDVDNLHTRKQLKEYYEYLLTRPDGLLWFSVPLASAGEAMRVAKTVRREARCERVGLIVSGWMLGTDAIETRWNA